MGAFIRGYETTSGSWPRVTRTLFLAPALQVLSIADAKAHLRIDGEDQNADIATWIRAATRRVEVDAGIALLTQTWDLELDGFPSATWYDLPLAPIQSVTSVTYVDTAAATITFAAANYLLRAGRLGLADLAVWPTDARGFAAVTIRVVAGYTSAVLVPADLVQAVKLVMAWISENREPTTFEFAVYEMWIGAHRRTLVA